MGEPMEERKERRVPMPHTHTHTHNAVGKEKGQRKEKYMYQDLVPKGVAVGSLFYVLHMCVE